MTQLCFFRKMMNWCARFSRTGLGVAYRITARVMQMVMASTRNTFTKSGIPKVGPRSSTIPTAAPTKPKASNHNIFPMATGVLPTRCIGRLFIHTKARTLNNASAGTHTKPLF